MGWFHGSLPLLLAIVVAIDVYRRREPWWWILVAFFFPVLGAVAYFAATRGPWATGIRDSRGTPSQRRAGARRRLAELETKLANWRSPAVLAEAGEELLVLGRPAEAEARFREAIEAKAPPEDTHHGLAEALVAQGRAAEAVAPLRELTARDPDYRLGHAQLLLARCLDETGQAEAAEVELRKALVRRNEPEARARLARLLVLRGARDEGVAMAEQLVRESDALAPGLRRRQLTWTQLARKVARGSAEALKAGR